jgi:hypothetical protein
MKEAIEITLGAGKVSIEPFSRPEGDQGLILKDTGRSHEVGVLTGSGPEPSRMPEAGEVLITCQNKESAIVLLEMTQRMVDSFNS